MTIPKSFIIHGHTITVEVVELCKDSSEYGYYDDVSEKIVIAKSVKVNDTIVKLSQVQIEHTFLHELIHCFQFHIKGEFDEVEAQSYAGLLLEFFSTSHIKIDPNTIYTPIESSHIETL
jgi:hypothetical protein